MSVGRKQELKDEMKKLNSEKDELEAEIASLAEALGAFPDHDRLVDKDGFPRDDIDIYQVRTIKNKLSRLQTDHRTLMGKIETILYQYFQCKDDGTSNGGGGGDTVQGTTNHHSGAHNNRHPRTAAGTAKEGVSHLPAFFLVDQVTEESPASEAGLRIGDRILKFGPITKANMNSISLPSYVKSSEGRDVLLTVYRNGEGICTVTLIPKKWNGPGLLGCHISPV